MIQILLPLSLLCVLGTSQVAADEPCVQEIVEDARDRLESDPEFPGQNTRRDRLDDVDGDGEPEELVSFRDLCGARNCTWAIYASGDGCSRYVGMFEAVSWQVLESSHHDLHDIATTWSAGCAGLERYEAVQEYDGREYRQVSNEYVDECQPMDIAED